MKKQKGITLIALIITIIVMLILVAVTINVALNGGLFKKASDASYGTENNTIYETIVSAMVLKDDETINVPETFRVFADSYGMDKINPNTIQDDETSITFIVTGKRGEHTYTLTTEKLLKGINQDADDKTVNEQGVDDEIVYEQENILPKMTLNSDVTLKYWENRPEYGTEEGKNAVKLQLTINNSSNNDRWYVNVFDRLAVFNDSIESNPYEYYFDDNNGQLSTFTSPGWYRNGELVSETNYPIFDGYHVETDSDIQSNEIEQYYEDLNTWYGDVFVKAD